MEIRGLSQSLFTLNGGFSEGPNPYTISSVSAEEEVLPQTAAPKAVPVSVPLEEVPKEAVEEDVLPPLPMEEYTDLEDLDYGMEKNIDVEWGPEHKELEEPHSAKILDVEDAEMRRISTKVTGQEILVEIEETRMHKEGPVPMDIDIDQVHHADKELSAERQRENAEEIPIVRPPRASLPRSPMAFPKDDVLGTILGVRTPKPAAEPVRVSPKQHKRKRKTMFDDVAVITSFNMKKQLGTSSDICRLRKKAPSTEYQIWMSQRDINVDQNLIGPSLPGMCPELKELSSSIMNCKFRQLDKDIKAKEDAMVVEPESVREEMNEVLQEGADLEYNVEEALHENGDRITEVEVASTKKQRIETEVPSTPPKSPQPQEAAAQKVDLEAVSNVRRRLEFEATSNPQQSSQPLSEVDAWQIQQQAASLPLHMHDEDATIVVTEDGENHVVPDGLVQAVHGEIIIESLKVGPSKMMEEMPRQQREATPSVLQDSEDLSDHPQSQGLAFLADSQEPDSGNGTANGAIEVDSSMDTESEHFGKFMQDKSGWAFRTRAVAEYLKEKFEDARIKSSDEQPRLSLCKLLKGKRRREAARMFFETVVLRSKDYVQVEQKKPFADIYIQPTDQLMRADL